MDLARLRGRMPLIAFILLAIVFLVLIGFICACVTNNPGHAAERATSLGGAFPPLIEMWAFLIALALPGMLVARAVMERGRASPALTQRFLF